MDAAVAHLTQYWIFYAAGLAVLVPLVYFTRTYSAPIIQAVIEIMIYFTIFHTVLWCIVFLTAKFKDSTQLSWNKTAPTPWKTPLLQFWDRALYEPAWLFYLEAVFAAGLIIAMIRMRPMRTQRRRRYESKPLRKGEVPEHLRHGLPPKGSAAKRK